MIIKNFKPESVQIFCNSQIFYISGINLTEVRDGEKILVEEGEICQLCVQYCSDPIKDKIIAGACLTAIVDKFPRQCKIRGQLGRRFKVRTFQYEDDIWKDDF